MQNTNTDWYVHLAARIGNTRVIAMQYKTRDDTDARTAKQD